MPHDRFFNIVFSRKEHARDLVLNSLPDMVIRVLDLESIEVSKESFVDQKLASRQSDILIRTRFRGSSVLIYVLVEHKSYPYRWTVFQLLKYMVRIWEKELAQNTGMVKLPLIIPLIFYHGSRKWRFPLDFSFYFDQPQELEPYIPDFKAHLYNLQEIDDRDIRGHVTYQAALKTMKHVVRNLKPYLREILADLSGLPFDEETRSFLSVLFRYILQEGKGTETEDLERELKASNFKKAGEVYMTIAEKLEEEGIKKGKIEGEIQEKQQVLLRLLEKKFGLKDVEKEKILNTRDRIELDRAIDLLLDAKTTADVLKLLASA
ncbi:hypothetical protein ES703_66079 [subsurface metagenome]